MGREVGIDGEGPRRVVTRSVIVEFLLLLVISLIAIGEGLRLVIYKDPYTLYDPLGPGLYAFAVGLGLLIVAVAYILVDHATPSGKEITLADKALRLRLLATLVACVIYISLIGVVGYLPATVCFFIMEFKIERIKSWPLVIALALILSGLYCLVFVHYCGMVFPRGIIP